MLTPEQLELQKALWALPLKQAIAMFDQMDKNGTDYNAIKQLCQVSLFYLIIKVLGWKEYIHPWSYDRIIEVEKNPNGVVDLWSRGHGKSSIITVAKSIQDLINLDNIAIIVFSHTFSKAKQHTGLIKQILETNDALKQLFPERFYSNPSVEAPTWNETDLVIKRTMARKEPSIKTCGFNYALPTGMHSDILVYDDVVTEQSVTTAEQIEKTRYMYNQSKPLGATAGYAERIIGTRYSFNDLFQELIDSGSYPIRLYPATDDGLITGNPVVFSQERWDKVCEPPTTTTMINNQYLLTPQTAKDRLFDIKNLQWWDVRPSMMTVYILADPAKSQQAAACDTAMIVLGVQKNGLIFILDGACHKMTLVERWERLKGFHSKWSKIPGVQKILVGYEDIQNDDIQYFESEMRKGFDAISFKIEPLTRSITGSNQKHARIERLEPDLRANRIWLPYDNRYNETNPGHPTANQKKLLDQHGDQTRIARDVIVKLKDGSKYSLLDILIKQLQEFPFSTKVDLIDALSRIYDMGIRKPSDLRDKYGTVRTIKRTPYRYHANYSALNKRTI